jgi:FkbM family methyltransferase
MDWSLANMRRLGFRPSRIVDIGAYKGEWAEMAGAVFPEASVLMLEAQENKRATLEERKRASRGRLDFRISLLGREARENVEFHQYAQAETAASVLVDHKSAFSHKLTCRMQVLDDLLRESNFVAPELLKLDVQGYELEVLKGGEQTMASAQAVLMEVSLIDLYQNNPLLHEVTAFMDARGFRAYDICSLMRRPLDDALCQTDIIFLKRGSPLLESTQWK